MSLEQRVARLEKELESRTSLPVMVWWGGMRDEALMCFLAKYGREPETEIGICFVAAKAEILSTVPIQHSSNKRKIL